MDSGVATCTIDESFGSMEGYGTFL